MNSMISKIQHETELDYLSQGWKLHCEKIEAERDRHAETIRCQQIVLDQIAQALGLEKGDVDGIGAAIDGLKRDAARLDWMDSLNHSDLSIRDACDRDMKALAAGEAE